MATPTTHKPKPKGALIAALVFLLLGIAGCGYAAARTVPYISDLVDFISDLDEVGSMVPLGQEVSFTATGSDGIALLTGEAVCTGEGPSGSVSFDPYEAFGPGTTVELGGAQIDGYILFDTESGSEYTIRCGDPSSTGSYTAATAPSFLVEGAPGVIGGIGAGLAGAFFVFLSIIFLIVGLVQRSSWKKKQNQGPGPATGYGAPTQSTPPPPGQGASGGWGSPPAPSQQPPPLPPTQQPPSQQPPQPQGPPPAPPSPQGPPPAPPQQPPSQQPPPPPPAG